MSSDSKRRSRNYILDFTYKMIHQAVIRQVDYETAYEHVPLGKQGRGRKRDQLIGVYLLNDYGNSIYLPSTEVERVLLSASKRIRQRYKVQRRGDLKQEMNRIIEQLDYEAMRAKLREFVEKVND